MLLLTVLTYCGWGIGNNPEKKIGKYAWIVIAAFGLIEGLRWLRGPDYWHYYQDLATCFEAPECTPEPELLYSLWINLFYSLGLHPTFGFIFYSSLLMGAYVLLFKRQPQAALWGLPVFVLLMGHTAENIVRQTFATSFLMLAYYYYAEDKRKKMWLSLACVPLIHISGLYGVALFILFVQERIPLKWPWLFVALYCFGYFFWEPDRFEGLADFLGTLNIGETSQASYLENAERWFTQEGSIANVLGTKAAVASRLYVTISFLTDACIVYFGFLVCKDNVKLHLVYYFAFIGLMIKTISGDIEILSRFAYWTYWMIPVVIGLIMAKANVIRNQRIKNFIFSVFAIRFIFYGLIRIIGTAPYAGCGFIWDK
ncbi:MAG: EpsG family protein [Bacteroidaceae bacterium]|nr:EpsG family protein [Bacteroidaceae bacterium]